MGSNKTANSAIIDVHSHILPGIDDGARDLETAIAMLGNSESQGITHMVATPHFYGWSRRIEVFLDDRARAMEQLKDCSGVKLLAGAEVAYFEGLNSADGIEKLTVEGSDMLLLEMPFKSWSDRIIDEVYEMSRRFHLILAHIERYRSFKGNRGFIEEMSGWQLDFQCNAEALLNLRTRGYALKLFKQGKARFLASDTHNNSSRPQNLMEGRKVLAKKAGSGILEDMDNYSKNMFLL